MAWEFLINGILSYQWQVEYDSAPILRIMVYLVETGTTLPSQLSRPSRVIISKPLLILVCAFLAGRAAAQTAPANPEPVSVRTTPRRFVSEEYSLWTSPFRRASYNSHAIKKYVIPFVLVTGALIATDHKTADGLPNSTDQTRWSGRVSQMGAWYSLAGISGGTFLAGQFTGNSRARETGWLALEALGHAQIAVFAFKQLTNRERPIDNISGGSFWKGGNSFPSGHATSAFAVAAVFAYEYRDHIAVPITAYSIASLISASRVGARRHWVSDIFAGGSMGFLIGRYTYKKNHAAGLSGMKASVTDKMVPDVSFGRSGPVLSWSF